MLFLKTFELVTEKNCSSSLLVIELGDKFSFEDIHRVSSAIFLPIISNSANQEKWGELTSQEIIDRFHSFLLSTTILCGQIKGETRLPLPPQSSNDCNNTANLNKNRISILENAIITWTKQIKNVLKGDPENRLKQGLHPNPSYEVQFWKLKAKHLNSIFEQLQGQRVRQVLCALDQAKSTYCTTFA